jgi:hypothetical protein
MEQTGTRAVRRVAPVFLSLILMAWVAMAIAGLHRESPFRVAIGAATTLGAWTPEQVRLDRGSYRFRFLYSVVEAQLEVTTENGVVPARIEMRHVPLFGWSVRRFESPVALRAGND